MSLNLTDSNKSLSLQLFWKLLREKLSSQAAEFVVPLAGLPVDFHLATFSEWLEASPFDFQGVYGGARELFMGVITKAMHYLSSSHRIQSLQARLSRLEFARKDLNLMMVEFQPGGFDATRRRLELNRMFHSESTDLLLGSM